MPIESTPAVGAVRPVGALGSRRLREAAGERPDANVASVTKQVAVTLDAGPPPVDAERVAVVRKAIEAGTYPLVPMKIADAMIAAGLLLRVPK